MIDPVTGPLSRDELKALADAPAGAALKAIRKFDPLYGLPEGTKVDWQVTATREAEGYAIIKAASKEEAQKLAKALKTSDFEWDDSNWCDNDHDIVDVGVPE